MQQVDVISILVGRFPRLFRGEAPVVMSYVPAGWIDPVARLFEDIDAMLDDGQAKSFAVLQLKEKFASLRVYWQLGKEATTVLDIFGVDGNQRLNFEPEQPSALFDRISARVSQAEDEAAQTCQRCGNGGASARALRGYLVTMCGACARAHKSGKGSMSHDAGRETSE